MAQYSCLEFRNIVKILNFENATILAPKNYLPFSNPVLLKVLSLKEQDDYFCGTRGIKCLSDNFAANEKTVENLMEIYVT